jgi:hypothetical protein
MEEYLHRFPRRETGTENETQFFKMAKRAADVEDGSLAYQKRQKISTSVHISSPAEEITSARQLRQILAFDQDVARSKHGRSPIYVCILAALY